MAFSPCAVHQGMYRGGASTFFLRIVDGNDTRGGKLKVCPNDASILLDWLQEHSAKVSEGETFYQMPLESKCMQCGNDVERTTVKFFGNAYARGHVESQWFGYVCRECVESVATDLCLDRAEP
jgi:hypothetical protein